MTVRTRLIIITILGLAITMALWGWVQIQTLDQILVEQQGKRLSSVAETVSTYYQHFPDRPRTLHPRHQPQGTDPDRRAPGPDRHLHRRQLRHRLHRIHRRRQPGPLRMAGQPGQLRGGVAQAPVYPSADRGRPRRGAALPRHLRENQNDAVRRGGHHLQQAQRRNPLPGAAPAGHQHDRASRHHPDGPRGQLPLAHRQAAGRHHPDDR